MKLVPEHGKGKKLVRGLYGGEVYEYYSRHSFIRWPIR
jgi:hypothetical protein